MGRAAKVLEGHGPGGKGGKPSGHGLRCAGNGPCIAVRQHAARATQLHRQLRTPAVPPPPPPLQHAILRFPRTAVAPAVAVERNRSAAVITSCCGPEATAAGNVCVQPLPPGRPWHAHTGMRRHPAHRPAPPAAPGRPMRAAHTHLKHSTCMLLPHALQNVTASPPSSS